MADSQALSLENEVFSKFVFYSALLLLKMMFVGLWTSKHRVVKKVFITPEDYTLAPKGKEFLTEDPDIERARRCHRNDMENIPVFILLGFLYVLTKPEVWTASLIFRVFTGARFAHTIVYLNAIPQPARVLVFTVALTVNLYLAGYLLSVASL